MFMSVLSVGIHIKRFGPCTGFGTCKNPSRESPLVESWSTSPQDYLVFAGNSRSAELWDYLAPFFIACNDQTMLTVLKVLTCSVEIGHRINSLAVFAS